MSVILKVSTLFVVCFHRANSRNNHNLNATTHCQDWNKYCLHVNVCAMLHWKHWKHEEYSSKFNVHLHVFYKVQSVFCFVTYRDESSKFNVLMSSTSTCLDVWTSPICSWLHWMDILNKSHFSIDTMNCSGSPIHYGYIKLFRKEY